MNRRHFVKHMAGVSALSFVGKVKAQEEKLKKSGKKLVVLWMGRGPTKLISPARMLHSCGNSSKLLLRRKEPIDVK